MEKVKVTKEQAEAIERGIKIYGKDRVMNDHEPDGVWVGNLVKLNGLTKSEIAKAFYIGYEIEPEFKEKEWVTDVKTQRVARIDHRGYDGEVAWVDDEEYNFFDSPRHSTPEEIKQEKERRWWAKHNRIINEYKTADLVIHENRTGIWEVTGGAGDNATITNDFADSEQQVISKHLKLICPAENRLDLSN